MDREERPDVDAVYMEAVQLASGGGGWPMTVIALPTGARFGPGPTFQRANFLALPRIGYELWASERGGIETDAERLADAVREGATLPQRLTVPGGRRFEQRAGRGYPCGTPLKRSWAAATRSGAASGGPPSSPSRRPSKCWQRTRGVRGDAASLEALRRTLDAMSSGGIYDHLAGGFAALQHRPALARPPFRKDALRQRFARPGLHARLAVDRLRPLPPGGRRNRRLPAQPAPASARGRLGRSRGRRQRGRGGSLLHLVDIEEIEQVAGPGASAWYGASADGNWEGKNILWRAGLGDIARPPEIDQARLLLLERRSGRPRPGLDGKVLTEWNAMAIAALAYAGTAFGEPAWVEAAAGDRRAPARATAPPGRPLAAVVAPRAAPCE